MKRGGLKSDVCLEPCCNLTHLLPFRSFSSILETSEDVRASYLYRQWVGLGLNDVHMSNHTVLLSLPGSTPNTITDSYSHQCFLPYGNPCDQRGFNDQESPYAAYSASGSVQVLCPASLTAFLTNVCFALVATSSHLLPLIAYSLLTIKGSVVKVTAPAVTFVHDSAASVWLLFLAP